MWHSQKPVVKVVMWSRGWGLTWRSPNGAIRTRYRRRRRGEAIGRSKPHTHSPPN